MQTFKTDTLKWHTVDGGRHHIKLQPTQEMVCPDHYTVETDDPVVAEVMTPWETEDKMQLETDHAPFYIEDAANQKPIPEPNAGLARVETGAANLEEIERDNKYHVMWSEADEGSQ